MPRIKQTILGAEGLPPGVYQARRTAIDCAEDVIEEIITVERTATNRRAMPESLTEIARQVDESQARSLKRRKRVRVRHVVVWNIFIWINIAVAVAIVVGVLALLGVVR